MDDHAGGNSAVPTSDGSKRPVEAHPKSKLTNIIRKRKKKKSLISGSDPPRPSSPSSSSSSCSVPCDSVQRGFRVSCNRRKTRVLIGSARQKESDVLALALPLGMSIAAVVAQVLERKDEAGEYMSVDHLSSICTLAVRESLANVFGDKFDSFASNFEKSFRSTLLTLRLINESSQKHRKCLTEASCSTNTDPSTSLTREGDSTCQTSKPQKPHSSIAENEENVPADLIYQHGGKISQRLPNNSVFHTVQESFHNTLINLGFTNENCCQEGDSIRNLMEENTPTDLTNRELSIRDEQLNRQLISTSSNEMYSVIDKNVLATLQKSVIEQARSNDLKTYEIGLSLRKLKLKETQLSLNSDLNFLERCKLSMGVSKASFKAEKFKNQLEDSRYGELLKKCIDCLVAGLFIVLGCLGYGAYVFSHHRITEATAACTPTKESKSSWWMPNPMASFNSGIQVLMCHVQVGSRILFGGLMILSISYLLLQRASTSNQTMPVTFIFLLLGVACGFAGKLCVDALGGSGYHWVLYWESLLLIHLFSNIFNATLYTILHGPIVVVENSKKRVIFPYWIRRLLFYATVILFLPLLCGFSPFAGFGEWKDHFSLMLIDLLPGRVS